jgi:hypothetical protein
MATTEPVRSPIDYLRRRDIARRLRLRRIRSLRERAAGFANIDIGGSAPDTPEPVRSPIDYLRRRDIARSISRFVSRSAIASRRSACLRPRASPSATLAQPCLK